MSEKLDKVKDLQGHTKLPCEKETHCLICIPLRLGMQIFGVLSIIGGILNIFSILGAFSVSLITGVVTLVFCLVGLYSAFLWYTWFKKDDKESTEKIVWFNKICYIVGVILTIVFSILFLVMGGLKAGLYGIIAVVANILLTIIIGWYFFQVTVRYHVQNYGATEHAKIL